MSQLFISDNLFKIKYSVLDESLLKYKNKMPYKMLLAIDVGYILDKFYSISKKNSVYISKRVRIKFLVGILNIISHYRHYYFDKLNMNNSVLLYCSTKQQYRDHDDILVDLREILNFIPSTIYIDDINEDKTNNNFYSHFVYHMVDYYKKTIEKRGKKLIVNILSSNYIDFQILNLNEDSFILRPRKTKQQLFDYKTLWSEILEDSRFNDIKYGLGLKQLFLPYCVIFNKKNSGLDNMLTTPNENIKTRLDKLFEYIKTQPFGLNFIKNYGSLYYSDENLNEFVDLTNNISSQHNSAVRMFIGPFFKMWRTKLKDNKIYSINDLSTVFNIDNIKINWLLENGS